MKSHLSKKALKKALETLKSALDEQGKPLPVKVKVPLALELENIRKEKQMLKPIAPFNRQYDKFGLPFLTFDDQSRTLDQMLARINLLSKLELARDPRQTATSIKIQKRKEKS